MFCLKKNKSILSFLLSLIYKYNWIKRAYWLSPPTLKFVLVWKSFFREWLMMMWCENLVLRVTLKKNLTRSNWLPSQHTTPERCCNDVILNVWYNVVLTPCADVIFLNEFSCLGFGLWINPLITDNEYIGHLIRRVFTWRYNAFYR